MKKLKDLLESEHVQEKFLVDGLLTLPGLSVLVAKPKVGKSILSRQLALAAAQGTTFIDRGVLKVPVTYLCLEDSEALVKNHFLRMGAIGDEDITFCFSLADDGFTSIEDLIEKTGCRLLIVDTMFKALDVKSVTNYCSITDTLMTLGDIAKSHDCHVMLIHHHVKGERDGGDEVLGSQAILGSVDTALTMRTLDRIFTLTTKQRAVESIENIELVFDASSKTFSLLTDDEQVLDKPELTIGERLRLIAKQKEEAPKKPGRKPGSVGGSRAVFLNIEEAANFLKLKKSSMYGLVHEKKIRYHKAGSRVLFAERDLLDFIKTSEKEDRPFGGRSGYAKQSDLRHMEMVSMAERNLPIVEIAQKFGVTRYAVYAALRKHKRLNLDQQKVSAGRSGAHNNQGR